MTIIYSLIRKEFIHLMRDPRTLLIAVGMPVILLILFGFAISMEINSIKVAAAVSNPGEETNRLIAQISANPYIDFLGYGAEKDIEPMLRSGKAEVGIIVRKTEGKLKVQILVDASNSSIARSYSAYLTEIISGNSSKQPVVSSILYNPQLKSSYNFVPGILGMIFILICAILTSVSIVREKESGTMNLLMVSPVRPASVIIGKLVPYLLLSFMLLILMLTISYTLLDIPFSRTSLNVILLSVIYITLSLSIGLLVSTLVRTQFQALIVSAVMFMIPVVMLSGMIFPISNMPDILQWISCIVPARWYVSAMRKVMIQELPLSYIMTELCVLCTMTAAILLLAIRSFKRNY